MRVGSNKSEVFNFLVDRVNQKLQAWGMQKVSKAGKVTLLKTAAQSIPNFWMSLLLLPREICDRIEKSMNAYWWGGGSNGKGIKWLRWDKLCEAKEMGGLGFRKLLDFNVAMLGKQAWRLITCANPLVTSLLKAKYYPQQSFLEAELGPNPSYMWRSIMAAQHIVKEGCRRKIGDGKDTRVWHIPWLPCIDNGCVTSDFHVELENAMVHNLMKEDQNGWDEDILNDLFNDRDRLLIQQVPIPGHSRSDSWYWLMEEHGVFSVKSCYRLIRGESTGGDEGFWKQLWGIRMPGKVINLIWRACKGVFPTATELVKRRVNMSQVCT